MDIILGIIGIIIMLVIGFYLLQAAAYLVGIALIPGLIVGILSYWWFDAFWVGFFVGGGGAILYLAYNVLSEVFDGFTFPWFNWKSSAGSKQTNKEATIYATDYKKAMKQYKHYSSLSMQNDHNRKQADRFYT
ncbi:hypothetical protein, partial [Parabacteroides sp.]